MKRFVFRLESVLKLRRHELESCQRDLGIAQGEYARVKRAMETASIAASERAADLIALGKEGVCAERFGLAQLGVEQAFRSWRRDEAQLEEVATVVERVRGEVTRAHTAVRALEKLRERALERHRAECAREEMRSLDEIAGRRQSLISQLATMRGDLAGEAS